MALSGPSPVALTRSTHGASPPAAGFKQCPTRMICALPHRSLWRPQAWPASGTLAQQIRRLKYRESVEAPPMPPNGPEVTGTAPEIGTKANRTERERKNSRARSTCKRLPTPPPRPFHAIAAMNEKSPTLFDESSKKCCQTPPYSPAIRFTYLG